MLNLRELSSGEPKVVSQSRVLNEATGIITVTETIEFTIPAEKLQDVKRDEQAKIDEARKDRTKIIEEAEANIALINGI